MKNNTNFSKVAGKLVSCTLLVLVVALGIIPKANAGQPQNVDSLYIGDAKDSTVKRFDVPSGEFGDTLVTHDSGGLNSPRGLLFDQTGNLLVANQNVNLPIPGEILRYDGKTGKFLGALVPSTDPNTPFAPRGIVLGNNNTLYVADLIASDNKSPGRVARYDASTGAFLGNLDTTGFTGQFYPRSLVFGPDGMLYVSVRNIPSPLGGEVLRFDPTTGKFLNIFVASDSTNDLNRPEGLVFGPDGNLYITSFRTDTSDTDKILRFNGAAGTYLDKIDLAPPEALGGHRSYAQALLFGPGGLLYVPITGDDPQTTGTVRRYDVTKGQFDIFVPSAHLGQPWYLIFGKTNSATLAYPN